MEMNQQAVQLSRRSARTVLYLNRETAQKFTDAVKKAESIDDVAQPYRAWLLDVRDIPVSKRKTRYDMKTMNQVVISIKKNEKGW
jgi:hypothetical protein